MTTVTDTGCRPQRPAAFSALLPDLLSLWRHRAERGRAMKELDALSDEGLRDIGVERHDIAAIVDRHAGRLATLDLGRR